MRRQFDQGVRVGLVLDIAGKRNGMTTRLGDFLNERVKFRLASRGDDNLGALSSE